MLTKIPEWSDTTLATEVDRIVKTSKCTYLDDLLMGVFIAYMKSFASVQYRGNASHINIDFDRPTMARFIHELYIQAARKLWQVAYLFKSVGVSSEQQARNRQDIEQIIVERFEHVIRFFLPWESISKQFADAQIHEVAHPPSSARVTFDEETDDESVADGPLPLNMTDEAASIEFDNLDEESEEEAAPEPPKEPEDPMKDIESRVESSLVLNL
jgi:hypothetical protein